MRFACTLLVAAGVVGITPAAQEKPPDREPFRTGTTAIMIDVVVRDRQGRPVTDLTAPDFELYEDDVRQEIGNVTLVAPGAQRQPAATAAAARTNAAAEPVKFESAASLATPSFVALVFDRLSPEARALAHRGALAYLEGARPDDFAGVFLIDLHLETIQTYTNDRSRLRKAIDEVGSRATSVFSREADRVKASGLGDLHPSVSPTASAEHDGPPDPQTQAMAKKGLPDPALEGMLRMAERMERSYAAMVRDQQGFATTNGLLALIDALGVLPGRKTVVFFAEGLAIPPNVQSRFDSVVVTANRANVSVYSVDAAGLRVHSKAAETARQVMALGEIGIGDRTREDKQAWTKDLELNEDILKQDPAASLGILAEWTGGFLINNTNDLERGFRQIDSDRRFHYLLTYSPKNSDFRGEWRRVSVKVPGRDVTVRARSGYVALRAPGALPLLSYEGPALAALERTPLPADIDVRANAFVFPQRTGAARVALLVATAADALTFDVRNQTYRTDFTVLARIKDSAGEIVRKASHPYRLTGPAGQVDAAKRGDVLFFRQPELDPGAYTVEYVVHDALGKRTGAGTAPLVVPDAGKGQLQMSSVVIVQRTERVPADERDDANPLYYGDLLLYPNLGEPVSKSAAKSLAFYFTVLPGAGGPPPSAALELVQGGKAVGQVPLQLGAPAADGRVQHVSQLPLAAFPPGEYELRVTLTQGSQRVASSVSFRIVE